MFINYNYIIINNNSSYQNQSNIISVLAKSRQFTYIVKVHHSSLHHVRTTNTPSQSFYFSAISSLSVAHYHSQLQPLPWIPQASL